MSSDTIDTKINTTEYINKLYDNLSFVDTNISSILLFLFITTFVILVYTYCAIMRNSATIRQNWDSERCKPSVMPFAGIINNPAGQSVLEFTTNNFRSCINSKLFANFNKSIKTFNINSLLDKALAATQGLTFSLDSFTKVFDKIQQEINGKFDAIQDRFSNILSSIQMWMYSIRDIFSRSQAILLTGVYTSLTNSYIMKSMMTQMIKYICNIFGSLFILIGMLYVLPMTQSIAIGLSVVTFPLAITFAATNKSLGQMFHIKPGKMPSKPKISKCFDKNTLLQMNDGTYKPISDIQPGDILYLGNMVTSTFKLDATNVVMYNINGIIVSDCHRVLYKSQWIFVVDHPDKQPIDNYAEPFIYCLNTTNKNIVINNNIFLDWDELYEDYLEEFLFYCMPYFDTTISHKSKIHKYLDGGFVENTEIIMNTFKTTKIKDIQIGDILCNGSKVYGIVKIKGDDLNMINTYNLGHRTQFVGGPNLNFIDINQRMVSTLDFNLLNTETNIITQTSNFSEDLYHLLTDSKTFYVGSINFCDYNSLVDRILDCSNKNKPKINK